MATSPEGIYKERRMRLSEQIRTEYPEGGILLLCASVEEERHCFRQDSTFYYYTGLQEPGLVCVININTGQEIVLVPQYTVNRSVWVQEMKLDMGEGSAAGFDEIRPLGKAYQGYSLGAMTPYNNPDVYDDVYATIRDSGQGSSVPIFMTEPVDGYHRAIMMLLKGVLPPASGIHFISSHVARMRRCKDSYEVAAHNKAMEITAQAHRAARQCIKPGAHEAHVKATLEYTMAYAGMQPAFPSIVASGVRGTILHYTAANQMIEHGNLVVVDIGAEYAHYAADITRTYPASGLFSVRQRELYQLVLDVQEFVAMKAKPGYWLKNGMYPERSLHHLAVAFFRDHGSYDQYFMHGIGHYLGLDVHDVGGYQEPLAPGDMFTIEPGLYLRQEGIGIRIEDNYLMQEDGLVCTSSAIAKAVSDVERQ
jgi:Xaa-Pro aminopeptidase